MIEVSDVLGRRIMLARPAMRVASLVPSETESVVALAGIGRLVARTEYCEEPRGVIEVVPTVGGTKSVDVAGVIAAAPDLVLANKEENTPRDVRALEEAGLVVHVSLPMTARDGLTYAETLARMLDVPFTAPPLPEVERPPTPTRVFVPIWREPFMTMDARTYASDLLTVVGCENVFADRERRYPLAADLGRAPALGPDEIGERDTRYPRVGVDEICARAPELVLLPDEPYRFGAADVAYFEALGAERGIPWRVVEVSGKDLFWYGTRTARAVQSLSLTLEGLRPPTTSRSPRLG